MYSLSYSPDIDECICDQCGDNATCVDTIGSFICNCREGFTREDEFFCISELIYYQKTIITMDGLVDIDECTSSPCGVSAECIDTVGSFVCICTYVTTNACLAAAIINAMRASSHTC